MNNGAIRKVGIGVLCLVPVITALIGLNRYWKKFDFGKLSADPAEWGQFGDFIGGIVNPSVGLVTIILLVLTLRSQENELREQRNQIALQAEAQDRQTYLQAFEQTFFSWLTTLRETTQSISFSYPGHPEVILTGTKVFEYMARWDQIFGTKLSLLESAIQAAENKEEEDAYKDQLIALHLQVWKLKSKDAYQAAMVPFRVLLQLMKYVDDQKKLDREERQKYMNIIRSTIGLEQLKFMFLARSNSDVGISHTLFARYRFFFFIKSESGSPLISALIRHDAHNFSNRSFNRNTLNALKKGPTTNGEEDSTD